MKIVLDEFHKRREHLSTIRYGDDRGRLSDLLVWLEAQPEINRMILELRSAVDVSKLFSPHGFRPKASTQDEIAAVGLHLLDMAKNGMSLHGSAIKLGISPTYGGGNAQDYVDETMTCYINPFLDHVETGLENLGDSVTVENVAELRFGLLNDPAFQSAFPATAESLKKIGEYCGQSEDSGSWFHVAASCRETLGTFVRELQSQQRVIPLSELKQGDTKGILKQLVRERADVSDALVELIQAVWVYVQSNVHRQAATKSDALRVYLWTGLLISEIWLLVKTS